MSATTTYSAHVTPAETGVEVIIRRAIPAGIDGPFGGFTLEAGASMSDVSAELERHGYAPVELDAWKVSVGYDGLRLDAELTRRERPEPVVTPRSEAADRVAFLRAHGSAS